MSTNNEKINRATQLKTMRRGQWEVEARWVQGIGTKREETQGKKKERPGRACKRSKIKRQDKPQKMSKQLCVEIQLFKHSEERKAGRRLGNWIENRWGALHPFFIKGRGQYALTSHPLIIALLLAFRRSTYVLMMLFCFRWDAPNGNREDTFVVL